VLKEKTDVWHHGVSPSSRQQRLESLTDALRSLANAGFGAASILANIHHRRITPLMERDVDGVFWYTKHVHYTLVWICLWN
jgi:hypothetical protein